MDRVTAVERATLSAYDLKNPDEKPEADVAADPGRLAMWEKERKKRKSDWDGRFTTWEVTGCGLTAFYGCGGRNKNAEVICVEAGAASASASAGASAATP